MFVTGQSTLANMVFSVLTFLVAIPSAVKVFNWVATLYRGIIDLKTPMLYALSLPPAVHHRRPDRLFLGALAVDVHLHDTYFVVAHFHYVMMGGTVIAFLGGLHYWWPKMFGRMYNEKLARIGCALVFIGFNVTFFTQFILGTRGMPRRYYNYLDQFQPLHAFSTLGRGSSARAVPDRRYLLATFRKPMDAPRIRGADVRSSGKRSRRPSRTTSISIPVLTHGPYDYRPERPTLDEPVASRLMSTRIDHIDQQGEHHAEHDPGCSTTSPRRTAVRRREDRHVAVPGDRNPAVRRTVRRLRACMQSAHPQAFLEAHHHLDKTLGALNTVVLLFSSFTMVMAVHRPQARPAQEAADQSSCRSPSLCAAIFLVVKYFEYQHKFHDGLLPGAFYRIKDDHGPEPVHLLQFLLHDDRPARHAHPGRYGC